MRRRRDVRSESESAYMPPRSDVNAPDLYIPLMAFITYVLAVGYSLGLGDRCMLAYAQASSRDASSCSFKPEILGMTASSCLGFLLFEVIFLKLGLYLLSAPSLPIHECVAFAAYKYVGYKKIRTFDISAAH